jgi:hypothetical protein
MGLIGLRNPAIVGQSQSSTTATPSIASMSCVSSGGDNFVRVPVTNNDASSATVEISTSSTFAWIEGTATVASGASNTFEVGGYSNPPGSVTFYARATATGKSVSTTASRTQTISACFGGF